MLQETPPRAWGRPHPRLRPAISRKHPHGRGEDRTLRERHRGKNRNTPTGVGKTLLGSNISLICRNTPTGVGKTCACACRIDRASGNTPTGVGKTGRLSALPQVQETPPRAWGRPSRSVRSDKGTETPPRAWGRQREIIEFFTDNPNRIAAYPFPKPVASQKWLLSAGADRPGRTVCTPEPLECVEI